MTDKSSSLPSPDNTPGSQRPQQDGVDLVDLLSILINNKKSLLFTTFSFALLSVLYALSLASVYQTEVAFLKPPESFVPQIFLGSNEKESTETPFYITTSQSLYYKFLTRVQSYEHQRRVFDSGHFFNKFSSEALEPDKLNNYFLNIHESIALNHEPLVKNKDAVEQFQKPLYLAIKGTKPEVMSEFLNAISETAKKDIKKETLDRVKKKIDDSLQNNIRQTGVLSFKINEHIKLVKNKIKTSLENKARKIKILKKSKELEEETNARKIKILKKSKELEEETNALEEETNALAQIKSRIELERNNKIKVFEDARRIARSLKIKDPNFGEADNNKPLLLPEPLNKEPRIPIWFLYGESALDKEIEILKSRASDSRYNENLIKLKYAIERLEVERSVKLKRSMESVPVDDEKYEGKLIQLEIETEKLKSASMALAAPGIGLESLERLQIGKEYFDDEKNKLHESLVKLKIEAEKLKSMDISLINPDVVIISQPSIAPTIPIEPRKRIIVLIGTGAGLLFGFLAALSGHAMGILRKREKYSSPV